MVANILPADPSPPHNLHTLGIGSVGQNSTFSEHGHVAYQIENNECSKMVVNILPADPHPLPHRPLGWGQ